MTLLEALDKLPGDVRLREGDRVWTVDELREAATTTPDDFDYEVVVTAEGRLSIAVHTGDAETILYVAER